jgi:hypothetical protein
MNRTDQAILQSDWAGRMRGGTEQMQQGAIAQAVEIIQLHQGGAQCGNKIVACHSARFLAVRFLAESRPLGV